MVSTRTTAQSQREVQRLDCPGFGCPGFWLSIYYAPWGWRWYYTGSGGPGGGRAPPWLEVRLADASPTDGAQDTAATPRKAAVYDR